MRAGSGLASGLRPEPALAEAAVRQALHAAGLQRAGFILLFLTHDFAAHAQAAVLAAARAGACLDVGGGTASGLLTEQGWLLDQSGAAAMVFETPAGRDGDGIRIGLCSHGNLPAGWREWPPRAGLIDSDGVRWNAGRSSHDGCTEIHLPAGRIRQALSPGLRILGDGQTVDRCRVYDLLGLGGQTAVDHLRRTLPPELRADPPWHQIVALRSPDEPGIPILSANTDGSLTLAAMPVPGEALTWALRQPLAACEDMRKRLETAVDRNDAGTFSPDCALMFSCIGRGPLFYGTDDLDLQAFRERFPDTPLLGAYGSGQIASTPHGNRLFHNAVTTLLFESEHV